MRLFAALMIALFASQPLLAEVEDFTFLQVSDMHLNPRPEGASYEPDGRSVKAMEWIAEESGKPQEMGPFQLTVPAPEIAIFTGDLFEYSVIGDTWGDLERLLAGFKTTNYLMPGNHDNTWSSINPILRELYDTRPNYTSEGHYAFTYKGVRFIQINTSGLLEPVPAIPRGMLTWLKHELQGLDPEMPIILSMHHPLIGSRSYASEYDTLRLHELLRGRRVVLMLDGHWHNSQVRKWHQYDSVCGGTTFGKNTGYNIISIKDGILRVTYRYKDDPLAMRPLIEKPIMQMPEYLPCDLILPEAVEMGHGVELGIALRDTSMAIGQARLRLDGNTEQMIPLQKQDDRWTTTLETGDLMPGRHYVAIEAEREDGKVFTRSGEFIVQPDRAEMTLDFRQIGAGTKSIVSSDSSGLVVGGMDGNMYMFGPDFSVPRSLSAPGGQVVHGLSLDGRTLMYTSDSGAVGEVDLLFGGMLKTLSLPHSVFAPMVKADGVTYVGDASGRVHALDLQQDKVLWSMKVADYGIEQAVVVTNELVIAGAWDGMIHAVDKATGEKKWSVWSGKGQTDRKSRYYGPADSPLVVIDDRLFVTDRGYVLGEYGLDGSFKRVIMEGVAGIGKSEDGRFFYGRGLSDKLVKFDATGTVVWEVEVPAGRLPIAPTERGGRVAITSNDGVLTVLDATDGSVVTRVRVSPGLYVQAPTAIDAEGRIYVADLDGVVTRVTIE